MNRLLAWLTAPRRRYLYRTTQAAAPVVVAYGLLSNEEVALWLGLVGALLVPELAVRNLTDDDGAGA